MNINPSTRPHSWMGQNAALSTLPIDQLILPGSHDSGADKQAPTGYFFEITQDVSPIEQIKGGVRVLDLRVACDTHYSPGNPERFQLFHLTTTGWTVSRDILDQLNIFFEGVEQPGDTQREIIILDFHVLKDFTEDTHREFAELIAQKIGHRIIPYELRDRSVWNIWSNYPGKNIVIAGDLDLDEAWDRVNQQWIGENFISTATLKAFMDKKAGAYKPRDTLRAIQCAKYVIAAADISDEIDEWFHSVDETSYIQGFDIINTDWTLRSSIVNNCIHASLVRALSR